jgi:hypothetical protein
MVRRWRIDMAESLVPGVGKDGRSVVSGVSCCTGVGAAAAGRTKIHAGGFRFDSLLKGRTDHLGSRIANEQARISPQRHEEHEGGIDVDLCGI